MTKKREADDFANIIRNPGTHGKPAVVRPAQPKPALEPKEDGEDIAFSTRLRKSTIRRLKQHMWHGRKPVQWKVVDKALNELFDRHPEWDKPIPESDEDEQ